MQVAANKRSKRIPKPSSLQGQTEFTLIAKQIDNSKVADIAAILKDNTSLTFLGFRGWVDDTGAKAIASSLCENKTLLSLSFDSTRVGHQGVGALARALAVKCPLTHLSLMYCPIQDSAVLLLIHALAEAACRLQVLRLDYCPDITDASAKLMLKALIINHNSRMVTVGLKDTAVSESIQREIRLLLLPGGRVIEKKVSASCEAAAYFTLSSGVKKSDLHILHGFADRVGPLSSTTSVSRIKPLPPPLETVKGVNNYQKYAYADSKTGKNKQNKKQNDKEKMEDIIDFAHTKHHLLPLLLNEQKRKKNASLSNIKMMLKFNATLRHKIGN